MQSEEVLCVCSKSLPSVYQSENIFIEATIFKLYSTTHTLARLIRLALVAACNLVLVSLTAFLAPPLLPISIPHMKGPRRHVSH